MIAEAVTGAGPQGGGQTADLVPDIDPLRDAPPSFRRYRRDEGAAIRLSGRWHLLGRVMMRVTASIKEVAKRLGRRPQIVC